MYKIKLIIVMYNVSIYFILYINIHLVILIYILNDLFLISPQFALITIYGGKFKTVYFYFSY